MANNYCLWSEEIGDLSDEEMGWLQERLGWSPPEEIPDGFQWPEWYDADTEGVGFSYDLDHEARRWWVYSEEYGNLSTLAVLVQEFLRQHRPKAVFSLNWADTCSKPRLGEFGGGAVVVTAKEMKWLSTYEWIRRTREEAQGPQD